MSDYSPPPPSWKAITGYPILTCNLSATAPDGSNYGGWLNDGTGGFKTAIAALAAAGPGGSLYVRGTYKPTTTVPTITGLNRNAAIFEGGAGFIVTSGTTYTVYSNYSQSTGSRNIPSLLVASCTDTDIIGYSGSDDGTGGANSTGILFGGGLTRIRLTNPRVLNIHRFGYHVTGYASVSGGSTYDGDILGISMDAPMADSCGQNVSGGDGGPIKLTTGSQTHNVYDIDLTAVRFTNCLQIGVDIISTSGTTGVLRGIRIIGGVITFSPSLNAGMSSAVGLHLEDSASGTGGISDETFVGLRIDGAGLALAAAVISSPFWVR